ncbi:MAG: ABC transporter ATP-binding protein [Deltaproteobacteria bacterium]|nr:ABC transporter ATP-binding protein [Deltaproteobacteria bacterium]
MRLLEVADVYSGYGATEVLHGVSMHVEGREIVTIIGPNGSGKSTLLKTIMGYLRPTRGRIGFGGRDVTRLRPDRKVRQGISYVPQLDNVFPSLTVRENLEMGGYFLPRRKLEEQTQKIYAIFPILCERQRQKAGTLSGGERQMVAMGSALMVDPRLILLDEPSAGLAPGAALSLFDKIKEINRVGAAIVIVEQNAYESLGISDRGYVLAMGQNEFEGRADSILNNVHIKKAYLGG